MQLQFDLNFLVLDVKFCIASFARRSSIDNSFSIHENAFCDPGISMFQLERISNSLNEANRNKTLAHAHWIEWSRFFYRVAQTAPSRREKICNTSLAKRATRAAQLPWQADKLSARCVRLAYNQLFSPVTMIVREVL